MSPYPQSQSDRNPCRPWSGSGESSYDYMAIMENCFPNLRINMQARSSQPRTNAATAESYPSVPPGQIRMPAQIEQSRRDAIAAGESSLPWSQVSMSCPRGSLSFDFSKSCWVPCLKASPKGLVDPPKDFPDLEYLRGPHAQHFVVCGGKLFNKAEGYNQSGFWMGPGVFVTTLHFGPWIKRGGPTQEMLEFYRGDKNFGFGVSAINHNINGPREDSDYIDVYLWKWNIANDLALFLPVDSNKQPPPAMIPTRCLVEADDLYSYLEKFNGVKMFAVGYNEAPDDDYYSYLRKYTAECPITDRAVPGPESLIWPFFKTVAAGHIIDVETENSRSELKLACTLWKGFFGGLIAVRYPQPDGPPLVFGHIVSAKGEERYNRGRFFPSGLREYIESACTEYNTRKDEPGELGFPSVDITKIPFPTRLGAPYARYMRPIGPPGISW